MSELKDFKELSGLTDGNILVVGSGSSIKTHQDSILEFKSENDIQTFGINDMTSLCTPDYHLWTNRQRLGAFGSCINNKSVLLFGHHLPEKNIRDQYKGHFASIEYYDEEDGDFSYLGGSIYGPLRTAGLLAVAISHIMGAKNIYIVGMDGYTLYPRKEIEKGDKSHHSYGKGFTDDSSWEECLKKDEMVYYALRKLKKFGAEFKILTPTKFEEFYDGTILEKS